MERRESYIFDAFLCFHPENKPLNIQQNFEIELE